jgi:hypothetical protein
MGAGEDAAMAGELDLLWSANVTERQCILEGAPSDSLFAGSLALMGHGAQRVPLEFGVVEKLAGEWRRTASFGVFCERDWGADGPALRLVGPFHPGAMARRPHADGRVSLLAETEAVDREDNVSTLALSNLKNAAVKPNDLNSLVGQWQVSASGSFGVLRTSKRVLLIDTEHRRTVAEYEANAVGMVAFADSAQRMAMVLQTAPNQEKPVVMIVGFSSAGAHEVGRMWATDRGPVALLYFDVHGETVYFQQGSGPLHILRTGRAGGLPATATVGMPGPVLSPWHVSRDGRRLLLTVSPRLAVCELRNGVIEILWESRLIRTCNGCAISRDGEYVARVLDSERKLVVYRATDGAETAAYADSLVDRRALGNEMEFAKDGGTYYLALGVGRHFYLPGRVSVFRFIP